MGDPIGDVLFDLDRRGLIQDHTDRAALAARLAAGPVTLYCGFDPTAASLHIGNLQQILALRRFQLAGHKPLALAGGATGMIGDPGGRSEERNLLDDAALDHNLAAITAQLERFLDFDARSNAAEIVDNRTWTADLTLLEFLRDVGKHVTVNQMTARESVKARLESDHGISYTEFSYMLLQANDYWWLNQHRGCELQIGGSDQWGNITAGVDLIRRRCRRTAHALTMPLITDGHGAKLGKSTGGGGTWLDGSQTSPYQLYQFFVQVDDDTVEALLLRLTLLPVEQIDEIIKEQRRAPGKRSAQRQLARAVTDLVHGRDLAESAEEASAVLFGGDPRRAGEAALRVVAAEAPSTSVSNAEVRAGLEVVDLVHRSGLTASKSDARRALAQGGIYVNGGRVDAGTVIGAEQLLVERYLLLRRGKHSYAVVEVDPAPES